MRSASPSGRRGLERFCLLDASEKLRLSRFGSCAEAVLLEPVFEGFAAHLLGHHRLGVEASQFLAELVERLRVGVDRHATQFAVQAHGLAVDSGLGNGGALLFFELFDARLKLDEFALVLFDPLVGVVAAFCQLGETLEQ